jgi:cystathionine gamma-synthase
VRAGIDRDTAYGAVTPPIVLSSNFSFAGFGEKRQYDYTRSGNPTRDLLAEALAELEGGAGAVVTATGMGAITLVLNALLQPGDAWWCRTMPTAAAGACSTRWRRRATSN